METQFCVLNPTWWSTVQLNTPLFSFIGASVTEKQQAIHETLQSLSEYEHLHLMNQINVRHLYVLFCLMLYYHSYFFSYPGS